MPHLNKCSDHTYTLTPDTPMLCHNIIISCITSTRTNTHYTCANYYYYLIMQSVSQSVCLNLECVKSRGFVVPGVTEV